MKKNGLLLAFLAFAGLLVMAAVWPTNELRVYDSGNTAYGSLTYDGTVMNIDTGLAADTNTLYVDAVNNRVGIGTATPAYSLDVAGTAQIPAFTGNTTFDSGTLAIDAASDRVGVGTTAPANRLTVQQTSAGALTVPLFLNNRDGTTGSAVAIAMTPYAGDIITDEIGAIRSSGSSFDLYFSTWASSLVERMRIMGDGKIGVGTSAPTELLDVAGNISVATGTYITLPGGCHDWGIRAAAPTSPVPVEGDRYWDSVAHAEKYYDGSTWN